MSRLGWEGAALFAFIPIVLWLYLGHPVGPGPSLLLGLLLMFGHRFVAAPWMERHATKRCLWCGRGGSPAGRIEVEASGRRRVMAVCGPAHGDLAGRFLTFVARRRRWIAFGIFAPLLVLLGGTLAIAVRHPLLPHAWSTAQFRAIVALTVVTTSLAYLAVPRPARELTSPFPLHNLFLLGIRNTLWVFRAVGAWWLAAALGNLVAATLAPGP